MLLPVTAICLTLLTPQHVPAPPGARVSLLQAAAAHAPALQRKRPDPLARAPIRGSRRIRTIVITAAVGAAVGGAVGYAATVNCVCDDPGYGVILGIPIGAIGGGLIGAVLAR